MTQALLLAIMTFAQRYDGTSLHGTMLLVPSGDPFLPLLPGATQSFAGHPLTLRAAAVATDAFPDLSTVGDAVAAAPLPNALAIFTVLQARFSPVDQLTTPPPVSRPSIRKALPQSYEDLLAPGSVRSPFAATTDEFGCALKDQRVLRELGPVPQPSWGHVISYALRNVGLARALGLVRDVSVTVTDPASFASGGWLFATLDPSDPLAVAASAHPGAVRSYASRVPSLATPRKIFAPVLFPVTDPGLPPVTPDASVTDDAFLEVDVYGEGFARTVHVRQPDSLDAATGATDVASKPGADAGIQIGWDDEQVLTWHNRQVALAASTAAGTTAALESPLGVLGYRVDVREPVASEAPGSDVGWTSLMDAAGAVPAPYAGLVDAFEGELAVEPTPTAATADATFWLPLYFAQWRGMQLGLRDDTPRLLAGGVAAGTTVTSPAPTAFSASANRAAPPRLQYGHTYQFRVRLVDLTSGGPAPSDAPLDERPTQRATLTFSRYVSPTAFAVATQTSPAAQPGTLLPQISQISLTRPKIGYPEALFTRRYGASDAIADAARAAFLAQLGYSATGVPPTGPRPAPNATLAVGLPDGDVSVARVTVEVRMLARDRGDDPVNTPLDLGTYVPIFEQLRPIADLTALDPDRLAPADLAADVPIDAIAVEYEDVPDVFDVAYRDARTSVTTGPLVLPRARDVRVRIAPIASGPANYFGTIVSTPALPRVPCEIGIASNLDTRAPASQESAPPFLVPLASGKPALCAMYFQPVPSGDVVANVMSRMANALDLVADGLMLRAKPGERVVFGAGAGFKTQVAPDASSLTFGSAAELLAKWTVVAQAVLARDWTWDGSLDGHVLALSGPDPGVPVASFALPRTASDEALASAPISRASTRIVFVDAIDPAEQNADDGVRARPPLRLAIDVLESGGVVRRESAATALALPLVIPPATTPSVVSAGYALSAYVADAVYASTTVRERRLWLEVVDVPAAGDALFVRVLANAPDPVLYTDPALVAAAPPAEPPFPLDAEYMRLIVPGQTPDTDGLEAMQVLVPANDDPRRFLLPLPPGVDPSAPELFGFYTYELRYGHAVPWSTAHGRFGRPLRLAGVQHPAPPLLCDAQWVALRPYVVDPVLPVLPVLPVTPVLPVNPSAPIAAARVVSGMVDTVARAVEHGLGTLVASLPHPMAGPAPAPAVAPTPAPAFAFGAMREIVLTAPFATPVRSGSRVGDGRAFTTIGFLLYAQVVQSDGATRRNVLVGRTGSVARARTANGTTDYALGRFSFADVETGLRAFGLSTDSPLSAIAVEFFAPGGTVGAVAGRETRGAFGAPLANGPGVGTAVGAVAVVADPFVAFTRARILRASPLTPVQPIC